MKLKKTITLEHWLVVEFTKKYPKAKNNFSKAVEGALIAIVNNPEAYWRAQTKIYLQKFNQAKQQLDFYVEQQIKMKKERDGSDVRDDIIKDNA